MEADDLYPNDSSYFLPKEPQDQVIARKKEKAQVLEGINVLKEVLERFEAKIAYYEANSSIPDEVRVDPQKFLITHNSYTIAAEYLTQEKEYIESLLDTHIH